MLGATLDARQFLKQVQDEITRLDAGEIERLAQVVYHRYRTGRFVYIIGNGGSGANSSHLCEDLGKGTVVDYEKGKRLKVLSLTDNTSYILAWANDTSYERVFVEQLKNLGEPGDLLIAISGSGNSPNILSAVRWANEHGIETCYLHRIGGAGRWNRGRGRMARGARAVNYVQGHRTELRRCGADRLPSRSAQRAARLAQAS